MATCVTLIYDKRFRFVLYGTKEEKSEVFRYWDGLSERTVKKITGVLEAINSNPSGFSHPEKFTYFGDKVWELKQKPVRLACFWSEGHSVLVAFYGFDKKDNGSWKPHHRDAMFSIYRRVKDFDFSED